ncbi:hypothetical protein AB205_0048560 [Aquarana catesbeiana]|uniref:Uncharacterized protein n=1 Tax=Aquarana catesbeiana TaxID=8400 RepID=A0A2G9S2H6_AQUCT|nr:hypothetical protein AB205_0048560 [Aquarana catesbeiana]
MFFLDFSNGIFCLFSWAMVKNFLDFAIKTEVRVEGDTGGYCGLLTRHHTKSVSGKSVERQ